MSRRQLTVAIINIAIAQWGGRPRPRRTPWSGPAVTRETEADVGVSRGPGGPPHIACSLIPSVRNFGHLARIQAVQKISRIISIEQRIIRFDSQKKSIP